MKLFMDYVILGSSGLLGQTLLKIGKKRNLSIIGLSRNTKKFQIDFLSIPNLLHILRKIKPKVILINLLKLATPQLLDEVVKRSQEDSLSHNDKRELFIKEKMSKFRGSKEQLEAKMMEVFDQYLSQNPV